jgi:hypothetical protein
MNKIERFKGDYAFLSNFHPAIVFFDGRMYPTVENAFQAAKCLHEEDRAQFATLAPGQAKRLGRKIKMRPDWNSIRLDVMRDLVLQKFRNHAELQEKLLATGNATLVEGNQWHDTFWGVCNGVGQNNLGQILMNVRGILRDERAMMERACEV